MSSPGWYARSSAAWRRCLRFSQGLCELCLTRVAQDCHHWGGYDCLGQEPIDRLLYLCRACHETMSLHRSENPSREDIRRYWYWFDPDERGFLPPPD